MALLRYVNSFTGPAGGELARTGKDDRWCYALKVDTPMLDADGLAEIALKLRSEANFLYEVATLLGGNLPEPAARPTEPEPAKKVPNPRDDSVSAGTPMPGTPGSTTLVADLGPPVAHLLPKSMTKEENELLSDGWLPMAILAKLWGASQAHARRLVVDKAGMVWRKVHSGSYRRLWVECDFGRAARPKAGKRGRGPQPDPKTLVGARTHRKPKPAKRGPKSTAAIRDSEILDGESIQMLDERMADDGWAQVDTMANSRTHLANMYADGKLDRHVVDIRLLRRGKQGGANSRLYYRKVGWTKPAPKEPTKAELKAISEKINGPASEKVPTRLKVMVFGGNPSRNYLAPIDGVKLDHWQSSGGKGSRDAERAARRVDDFDHVYLMTGWMGHNEGEILRKACKRGETPYTLVPNAGGMSMVREYIEQQLQEVTA